MTTGKRVNPDGVIGSPSLSVGGGFRLHSDNEIQSKSFFKVEATMPLKWYLSIFGGLNSYQELEDSDSDEYYGGLTIYLKSYTNENFDNPDCPVGSTALKLSGGNSEIGQFSQVELLFAPANSFTVNLLARSEKFDPPFDNIKTAFLGFTYYNGK